MILYFQNSKGSLRKIAEINEPTVQLSKRKAIKHIRDFCNARNFSIGYIRCWYSKYDNKDITKFDVGSHNEFFICDKLL